MWTKEDLRPTASFFFAAISSIGLRLGSEHSMADWRTRDQGIGAALLVPGSLALITATFPESERGRAIGTWSGFFGGNRGAWPVVGGWLIQHFSWRWVFFLNIPFALAVIGALLKNPRSAERGCDGRPRLAGGSPDHGGTGQHHLCTDRVAVRREPSSVGSDCSARSDCLASLGYLEEHTPAPMLPFALFQSTQLHRLQLAHVLCLRPTGRTAVFHPVGSDSDSALLHDASGRGFFSVHRHHAVVVAVGRTPRRTLRLPPSVDCWATARHSVGFAMFALARQDGHYWRSFLPAVLVMSLDDGHSGSSRPRR